MEENDSPRTSDSSHTPLQDEIVASSVTHSPNKVVEEKSVDDLGDEQLDYEEFEESSDTSKLPVEVVVIEKENKRIPDCAEVIDVEDGECDSDDEPVEIKVTPKEAEEGECESDGENENSEKENQNTAHDSTVHDVPEEDPDLKMEEVNIPVVESPWERGLRLARERRELAKAKKVQEKDKLHERQLHINLDNMKEVEPIVKPTETKTEVNQQMLKALQPIVVLPEEPKHNEMIMEYYLSESDYQHRPRFIPSKLYTLDPWEVDEWKRELDQIKSEIEAAAAVNAAGKKQRPHSRSISASRLPLSKTSQTSQFALGKAKAAAATKQKKQSDKGRELPKEHRSRMSSGSSSSSARSSSSSSASRRKTGLATSKKTKKKPVAGATYKTVKKPALGRARSQSSASSSSSSSSSDDDSGSSSGSSSDSSSGSSSDDDRSSIGSRKKSGGKKFINSVRPPKPRLNLDQIGTAAGSGTAPVSKVLPNLDVAAVTPNVDTNNDNTTAVTVAVDSELPAADSRPGVKLKLVARNKPLLLASSKPRDKSKKTSSRAHDVQKKPEPEATSASGIFSTSNKASLLGGGQSQAQSAVSAVVRESALRSNLAATQLEKQQEFLRNYKDKIAIYRSQLSYQQQQQQQLLQASGGGRGGHSVHPHTITHQQAPPLRGPITVMSVTSKKTGPPREVAAPTQQSSGRFGGGRSSYSPMERGDRGDRCDRGDRDDFRRGGDMRQSRNRNRSASRSRSRSRSGFGGGGRFNGGGGYRGRGRNFNGGGGYQRGDRDGSYGNDNNGGGGRYNDNRRTQNYRGGGNNRFRGGGGGYNGRSYNGGREDSYNGGGGGRGRREGSYGGGRNDGRRDGSYSGRGGGRGRRDGSYGGGGRRDGSFGGGRDDDRRDGSYNGRGGGRGRKEGSFGGGGRRDGSYGGRGRTDGSYGGRGRRDGSYGGGRDTGRKDGSYFGGGGGRGRKEGSYGGGGQVRRDRSPAPPARGRDPSPGFQRERSVSPAGWPQQWDNCSGDETVPVATVAPAAVSAAATLPSVPSVPKEKRREELLKQLKAVEDAIAKKRAKIDK